MDRPQKNKENLLQGRSDMPLNDAGFLQAEAVRERFRSEGIRFDAVYSSPLGRAVQTAKIVAGDAFPIIMDDRLIEMDYGPYEGMDLQNPAPEVVEFFRDFVHHPAPEGMEQLRDVVARLESFLEEIREEVDGRNILISTHAIAMKGALEYLTPGSDGSYWSKYIGNCAIYTVEPGENGKYGVPGEWKKD